MENRENLPKGKKRRASTLLIVISMLMALSVLGIAFSRMAVIERGGAQNTSFMVQARMNAMAGIDVAVGRLSGKVWATASEQGSGHLGKELCPVAGTRKTSDYYADWLFRVNDNANADVAAGRVLSNAHPAAAAADLCVPSYPMRAGNINTALQTIGGRYYSGTVDGAYGEAPFQNTYTLKIIDTASQINLNMVDTNFDPTNAGSTNKRLRNMLKVLFELKGIATPDAKAAAIINARTAINYFVDKSQILSVLTAAEYELVRDYVTAHGWEDQDTWADKYFNTGTRNYQPSQPNYYANNNAEYDEDPRAPINVNAAPNEVLVAVFEGLQGYARTHSYATAAVGSYKRCQVAKTAVGPISRATAQSVANSIITERTTNGPFSDWTAFNDFIDGLGLTTNEKDLIKANANPNPMINRWLPNEERYQRVDKSDLTQATTEFCFGPTGTFEIISVGHVVDNGNRTLAAARVESVVRVANLVQHTTQSQFKNGGSYNTNQLTLFPETEYHGSAANRITDMVDTTGSSVEGYIHRTIVREYSSNRTFTKLWEFPKNSTSWSNFWNSNQNLTRKKFPGASNDVRSVFKGEERTPEGALCFTHDRSTGAPSGGRLLTYSTVPGTAKEGGLAMWIKFDRIDSDSNQSGSDEVLVYISRHLDNRTGSGSSMKPGHGTVLKVIRYGNELHAVRFVWEDWNGTPPGQIKQKLKIRADNKTPEYLWSKVFIPSISANRTSRRWYRLVVGWEDYSKVYLFLSNDNGSSSDHKKFTASQALKNQVPNDGTKVTRLKWVSGSDDAAGGGSLGSDHMAVGGYGFKADRSGQVYGYGFSFNQSTTYYRYTNAVISRVEGYSKNKIKSNANNFKDKPYSSSNHSFNNNSLQVECGSCSDPSVCNKKLWITGGRYTFLNGVNESLTIDGSGTSDEGVCMVARYNGGTDAIEKTCGDNISYRATFNSGGATTPVFDDIVVYCRLHKPEFVSLSFPP